MAKPKFGSTSEKERRYATGRAVHEIAYIPIHPAKASHSPYCLRDVIILGINCLLEHFRENQDEDMPQWLIDYIGPNGLAGYREPESRLSKELKTSNLEKFRAEKIRLGDIQPVKRSSK
jgi:hypothetical protein